MRIAVTGAGGFIGNHLTAAFMGKGWKVVPIGRADLSGSDDALVEKLTGVTAVVNLAGASIAERWTDDYKKLLYSSRIDTTRKVVAAISRLTVRPEVFISASAVGIYDSEGTHTEESTGFAKGFLARLAIDWEAESAKAETAGLRTVIFRLGVVLGRDGGALKKMLVPFRMGLGGTIGDGRQSFSWVHIRDLAAAFAAAVEDRNYRGIYNLTAPHPSTNRGLTEALGRALGRPTLLRIPAFALKLQLGEGAQVLFEGQRVLPKRLIDQGFPFAFSDISAAIYDAVRSEA